MAHIKNEFWARKQIESDVFHPLDAQWVSCLQLSDYMHSLVFMGTLLHY